MRNATFTKINPQNQPQNDVSKIEQLNRREERETITKYNNQGVTYYFVDVFFVNVSFFLSYLQYCKLHLKIVTVDRCRKEQEL